ncbi:hypothetical protein B0H17DRAFT_1187805, partial [Mycena rosella]
MQSPSPRKKIAGPGIPIPNVDRTQFAASQMKIFAEGLGVGDGRGEKREEGRKLGKAVWSTVHRMPAVAIRMPAHGKEVMNCQCLTARFCSGHEWLRALHRPTAPSAHPLKKHTRNNAPLIRGNAPDAAGLDADFALERGGEGEGAAPEGGGVDGGGSGAARRLACLFGGWLGGEEEEGREEERRELGTRKAKADVRSQRRRAATRQAGCECAAYKAPLVGPHRTSSSGGERRPADRSL